MERWIRTIECSGRSFEVHFVRRPFREGVEVSVEIEGKVLRIAELGLGEQAALERLKGEIKGILGL